MRVTKLKFGIYLPRSSVLRRLKKCLIKLKTTAPQSFFLIILFLNKPSDLCLGLNKTWRERERERERKREREREREREGERERE